MSNSFEEKQKTPDWIEDIPTIVGNRNPFRDTSRDVEKLVGKDFSEDVLRSAKEIDKVLDGL
ncbi:hypothetical protein LCGC14_1061430 [marine sediment metagenome]|uniref:Uncharacterized protein n=1 Tax=marine sediment metagenome TaxID=412755 RepID=A0A0F9Q3Y9_9ZZZZ